MYDKKRRIGRSMKILFQGDSITDAGRNREDPHDLGEGYPKYAAAYIQSAYPRGNFEFLNLGISGNQTLDLVNRLQSDFVDVQPDMVSILIGINDVWHHAEDKSWISHDTFEARYRTVLAALKTQTRAKIVMLEPFLIPVEDKLFFREDLDPKIQIIRKLSREFADLYIPTDGLLASAFVNTEPLEFAADGVHPTSKGADFIGRLYADFVSEIIAKGL